jgi:hypothetical protein
MRSLPVRVGFDHLRPRVARGVAGGAGSARSIPLPSAHGRRPTGAPAARSLQGTTGKRSGGGSPQGRTLQRRPLQRWRFNPPAAAGATLEVHHGNGKGKVNAGSKGGRRPRAADHGGRLDGQRGHAPRAAQSTIRWGRPGAPPTGAARQDRRAAGRRRCRWSAVGRPLPGGSQGGPLTGGPRSPRSPPPPRSHRPAPIPRPAPAAAGRRVCSCPPRRGGRATRRPARRPPPKRGLLAAPQGPPADRPLSAAFSPRRKARPPTAP